MKMLKKNKSPHQTKRGKQQTLHAAHKSSEMFNNCDNGNVAFMQETLLKPSLFPATRSFSASNSRSAKYFL